MYHDTRRATDGAPQLRTASLWSGSHFSEFVRTGSKKVYDPSDFGVGLSHRLIFMREAYNDPIPAMEWARSGHFLMQGSLAGDLPDIRPRIDALREAAAEDGEEVNEASVKAFLEFYASLHSAAAPTVYLVPNGNIRAIWENSQCDQVGIQFLPTGDAQYVILRDRAGRTLKTLGIDSFGTVKQIVALLRLDALWNNG